MPLLSSSRIPDSLSLCSFCLQSPLHSLFHVGEKTDILLGTLQHAQSHSDVCDLCRLCSVYYSAIQRDGQYHKWIDHPQESGFSLYPPTRVRFHAITYRSREYWLAPMWHFYVFMGSMIRLWSYKMPSIHVPGCHEPVALVIQERRIAQGPFQLDTSTRDGQYLPARRCDAIMAGAESCHGTHTACARDVTDPSHAMTFRLIDVHTKTLINGLLWYPDPNRPALYTTFQQHRTTLDSSRRNTFPSWSWLSCIPRGVDFAHLQHTPAQTTYPARAIWKSNFGKDDTVWVIDTAQVHASNSSTLLTIMTESITATMVPGPMSPDWSLPPRWAVEQLERRNNNNSNAARPRLRGSGTY